MSLDGAQLSFVDAAGISVAHAAKGRKFNVGSYLGCDLVLPDAERLHCEIQCDAFGRVTIYNHSCTAPIVLNDQVLQATAKRPLMHGARIQILNEVYTWNFPQRTEDVSTPERAPPEPAANSSPSLKGHRQRRQFDNRLTVHNFRYSINSDDEGNTSIESRELETSSAEIASKDEPEPERSITPPAKEADETLPKVDLLEATQNKENTSTLGNRLMLQLCARSDVVITSFSPRETGVKIEKSFTCVLKPTVCVTLSSAASTPKSVYNTPKSVLSELNEDSCSRDLLEYSTPSTSKKAQAAKRPTSMFLIDLTTPQKLRPTLSVTPKQTPISAAVISVDSTDMSSDESPIVIDITNSSTPSKTPSKQQQMRVLKTPKDQVLAAGATPKRTPQSLMKRALLTSTKKQIAANTNTPTTPQAKTNRQSLLETRRQCLTAPRRLPFHPHPQWRTPGRRQLPALTTKAPQTSPRKRQSMSLSSPRDNKISMLRKTLAANAKLSPTVGISNKLVAKARRSLNSPKTGSPKRIASPRVTANESLTPDMAHDSTRELSVTFTIDDDDEQNATGAALKALMSEECSMKQLVDANTSSKDQSKLLKDNNITTTTDEISGKHSTPNETRNDSLNKTFDLNVSATNKNATDVSIRDQVSSTSNPEVVEESCDSARGKNVDKSIQKVTTQDLDKSLNTPDKVDVIEDNICEEVPTTPTYQEDFVTISSVHLAEDTICEEVPPSDENTPTTDEPIESEEQVEVGPPGQTPIPRRSSRRYSTDQNTVGLTPRRSVRRASMEATNKLEQCLKPTRRASCSAAVEIPTSATLATPKRKRRLTEELLTPSRKSQRLLCTTPKRAPPIDESVGDMGAIIEEDGVNADVLPIVTDEDYGTELPTKDADEPDKIDYHGMRELLKTPKSCSTPRFKGLREMVRTPKVCPSPMLGNIEELLETPSTPKRSVTVSRVELELSKAEATDDAQDKYFTTPRGKNLMIPNDPASAVLKTINKSLATTTEYDLNATNATLHLDKIFDDVLVAESTDPSIVVNNSENEINVTAISTAAASEADPLSTTTNPEASDTAGSEVLMNVCYAETSHKDPLTSTAFKDGGKTNLNLSALNDDSCADRAKSSDVCEMSGIQVLDQTTDSMFSERLVLTGVESCDVTLEETKATGNNIPEEKKDELAEGSDTDSMVGLAEPLVLSDDEDVVGEETNSNQDLIKEEKSNDFITPPKEIPKNKEADKSVVDQNQDETVAEVKSEINSVEQKEERSFDLTDVENDLKDKLDSTLGAAPSINDEQNNDQDTETSNNPNESQEENDFEIDLEASSIATDVSLSQIEVTQTSTIYGVDMSQVSSNIQGKETDKEDSMIQGVSHVEQSTENVVNKSAAILTAPIESIQSDLQEVKVTKSVEAITENDESRRQLEDTEANTTDADGNLNESSDGKAADLTLESANESLLNDSCEFNKSSIGLHKTRPAAETKRDKSIYLVPTAEASANPSDKPENDAAPKELSVEVAVKDESKIDASTTVAEESLIETSFIKNKSELCGKQVKDAIVTNAEEISDQYENAPYIKHISKISEAAVEEKNERELADEENSANPIPTTSEVEAVLKIKDVLAVVEDMSESNIKLDASVLDEEEKEQLPDEERTTQMTNEDSSIEKIASIVVETENNEEQIDNQASDISSMASANGTRQPQVDVESTSAEDSISEKTTEYLVEHVQDIAEMSLNLHVVARDAKNQSAETSKFSVNLSETDLEATNADVSEHIQDNSQIASNVDEVAKETLPESSVNPPNEHEDDLEATNVDCSLAETTSDEHIRDIADTSTSLDKAPTETKDQAEKISLSSVTVPNESQGGQEAITADNSLAEKTTEQLAEHIQDISQMSSNLDEVAKETLPESSVNSPNEHEVYLEATNVDCSLAETTSDEHIRDIADTSTNLDKAPTETKDQAEKISLSSVIAPNEIQDGQEATTADDSLAEKTTEQLAEHIQDISQMSSNLDEVAKETLPESSVSLPNKAEIDLDATNVDESLAKTISDEDIQHFEETSSHLDEVPTETKDQAEKISSSSISALNESQADPETKPAKTNTPTLDEIVENEEQMDNQASEKSSTTSANERSEPQVDLEPKSADDSSTKNATEQLDELQNVSTLDDKSATKSTLDESVIELDDDSDKEEESLIEKDSESISKSLEETSINLDNTEVIDHEESTAVDNSVINLDVSVAKQSDEVTLSTTAEKSTHGTIGNEAKANLESTNIDESLVDLSSSNVTDIENNEAVSDVPKITPAESDIEKEETVSNVSEILPVPVSEVLLSSAESDVVAEIKMIGLVSDVPEEIEKEETVSDISEILTSVAEDAIVAEVETKEVVSNVPEVLSSSAESDVTAEIQKKGRVSDVPEDSARIDESTADKHDVMKEAPLTIEAPLENVQSCLAASAQENEDLSKEYVFEESLTTSELDATNQNTSTISSQSAPACGDMEEKSSQPIQESTVEEEATNSKELTPSFSMEVDDATEKLDADLDSIRDQNKDSKAFGKSREESKVAIDLDASCSAEITEKSLSMDTIAMQIPSASGIVSQLDISQKTMIVDCENTTSQTEEKEPDHVMSEVPSQSKETKSTPTDEATVEILDSDEEDMMQNRKSSENAGKNSESSATIEVAAKLAESELALEIDNDKVDLEKCLNVPSTKIQSESPKHGEKKLPTSPNEVIQLAPTIESTPTVESTVEIIDSEEEAKEMEVKPAENVDNYISQLIASPSKIASTSIDNRPKQSDELAEEISYDNDGAEKSTANAGSASRSLPSTNDDYKDGSPSETVSEPAVEIIDSDGDGDQSKICVQEAVKNSPRALEKNSPIENQVAKHVNQDAGIEIEVSKKLEVEKESSQRAAPPPQLEEKIEGRTKTEEVVIDISSSDEESLTHSTSQKVNQVSHEKVVLESDRKFKSDDKEVLTEQHSLETKNSSDLKMDANPMNVLKRRRKSSTSIETFKDTTKVAQATPKRRGRKDDLVHEDNKQTHFTMEVHKASRNVEETTDSSHKSHAETVDLEKPNISRRKSITKNVETEVKKDVKATTSQPEINTDKPKRRGRKPATEIIETEVHEKLSDSPIKVKQQETVDLDKPKLRERKSSAMLAVTESQVVDATTAEAAETVDTKIPTEPKRRGRKPAKIVEAKVISSAEVSEIESDRETKEDIKVDIQTEEQGKVENLEKPKPRGRKPSIGETEIPAGDKPSRAGSKPSAEIAESKDHVAEVNELEKPKRRIRKASAEVVEATANLNVKKYELNRRASVDVAIVEKHEAVIHKEMSTIEAVKDNPRRRNRKVSSEVTETLEPINQTEKKPARNTRKASAETVEIDNEEKEHLPIIVEATEPEQKKLRLDKTTESDAAQKVNARGRKKSVSAEQPPEAVKVSESREKTTTSRGRKATNDEPLITPPAEIVEATTSQDKTAGRRGRKATNDEPLAIPPAEIVEATTSRGKSANRRGHKATMEEEPLPTHPAEIVEATTSQEKTTARRGRKATNDEALSTPPAEIVEATTSRGKSANRRGHKATVEEEPLPTPPAEIVEATTSQEKTTSRRGRKATNDEPLEIPSAEILEATTSRGKSANRRGHKATVEEEPLPSHPAEIVEATTLQEKTTARRGRKATNDEPLAIPPADIVEVPTSRGKSANRRGPKATVEEEPSPTPPAEIVEAATSQEKTTTRRGRKATNDEALPTLPAEIVEATTSQERTTARRGRKATNDEPLAAPLAEIVEATTRRGRKATVEEEPLSTPLKIVEVNSQEKSAIRSRRKATVDEELPSVQAVDAAELKPKRRARKASAEIVHAEVQPLEPTEATRRARGASADVAVETETAVEKKTTRRVRKLSANVDVIVEEATPPKKARRGRKASSSAAVLDEAEKQDHAIELATVASAIISPRPQVLSSEDELTPRRREGRNLPRKNYDETSDEDKPGSSRKARKPVASKAAAVSPLPKPTTPTKQSSVEITVEPVTDTQTPIATIIPADLTSSQKREGRNMPRKNYNETSDDEKPASSRGRRIRQPTIKALELLVDSASRPVTPKRRGKAKAADSAAAATEGDADTDEPPEKKIILDESTPVAAKARGGARGRKVHDAEEVTEAEPAKRGARSRKESATIQADDPDIEVEVKQPAKRNERGGGARKAKAADDAANGQPPIKKVRGGARAKTPVVAESVAGPDVEEPKEVPVTKRATAARGRNARVAKVVDEVVTITETPPTRTGRSRKVHFEAIEDTASVAVTVAKEAPQPVADEAPKRATRSRRK